METTTSARLTWNGAHHFTGTYDPTERWNGWLCPRFTRAEAERIVAAVAAENSADVERWGAAEGETLRWHGDVLLIVPAAHVGSEDEAERIEPDASGLYSVGAWAWTWYDAASLDATFDGNEYRDASTGRVLTFDEVESLGLDGTLRDR